MVSHWGLGVDLRCVVGAFLKPHLVQPCPTAGNGLPEQVTDVQGDIFRRGDRGGEVGNVLVQEGVVKGLGHHVPHHLLQHSQVTEHAGALVHSPLDGHLQVVVVPVAMGTGAFSIGGHVLFRAQLGSRQAMGCREVGGDGEESIHGLTEIIRPEERVFIQTNAHHGEIGFESLPDAVTQPLGAGQLAGQLRPCGIEEAEVQGIRHLAPDVVFHLRQVQHHAVGVQGAGHGDHQFVVMTMTGGTATATKTGFVVRSAQLRQPVAVTGAEGGAPRDEAKSTLPVGSRRAVAGAVAGDGCCGNGGRDHGRHRHS